MKIALVHDYLNEAGGAERVLRVLADMYPEAPIYTAFAKNGSAKGIFSDRRILESGWGRFLRMGRFYSYFRFLLPWVWRSIDLTSYDLVITSCSGYIARGFRVGKQTRVIAYCHTPPKWLYGYETPTDGKNHWWGRVYLWIFGPFVRYFDYMSAQRVNTWIANSQEVAKRVRKFYRKEAIVVYPPVVFGVSSGQTNGQAGKDYYLTVARVVGSKGLELAAAAAKQVRRKLIVVGELIGGKALAERVRLKGGEWVVMRGWVTESELATLYRGARGYLALARDEDFGMTVVEAMGHGVPIIALKSGGYMETVTEKSGIFIQKEDVESVGAAIAAFEKKTWDRDIIRTWARTFHRDRFTKKIRDIVGQ